MQIYVSLIDDGVEVWRPVAAIEFKPQTFRILGPMPDDERWQFSPGEEVHCQERVFSDGSRGLVAVSLAVTED
jgi:hypothetical protein